MGHDWWPIRALATGENFPLLKGYCLRPKFCPKVDKKCFPGVLVTVMGHAIQWERLYRYFVVCLQKV